MIEIMIPEWVVENEIEQGLSPTDVAQTYALALRKSDPVDWTRLNTAIIDKWGEKKLIWVKGRAWDYVEGRREFGK